MEKAFEIDRRGFGGLCAAGALATLLPGHASAAEARAVTFADGSSAPALGLGSWHLAGGRASPEETEAAMRLGISLGISLIDTAESYGDGRSEEMVGKIIAGQREKVFLVSKIMPSHATVEGIERSCRASLKRLGTDHLDLYLLHFRQDADLKQAVKGFEQVREQGLVRRWGVSNFAVHDMEDLLAIDGGGHCATNQVLYNLGARQIEAGLIPWCDRHAMPIMAYSPLGVGGEGGLLVNPVLKQLGATRNVSPAAIALAWAMRDKRTIAVTETGSARHVREDAAAETLVLTPAELETLDAAFPPPRAG